MKRLISLVATVLWCTAASAQVYPNIPSNTVLGRLGSGNPGPPQAIPFANFLATAFSGGFQQDYLILTSVNPSTTNTEFIIGNVNTSDYSGGSLVINAYNSASSSVTAGYLNCGFSVNTASSELGLCDWYVRASGSSGTNQGLTLKATSTTTGTITPTIDNWWQLGTASLRFSGLYSVFGTFGAAVHLNDVDVKNNLGIQNGSSLKLYPTGSTSSYSSLFFNGSATVSSYPILIAGFSSGGVTLATQSAAGTYNFNLPTTAGTATYVLTSQGGSSTAMTWTSPTVTVNGQSCTLGSTCATPGYGTTAPGISSCGTGSPSVTAGSNNLSGKFTLGTGTPTACTITFDAGAAFANNAFCTVSPASSGAAAITGGYYISAQSKTAFTLTIGTGTSSASFQYTCQGS